MPFFLYRISLVPGLLLAVWAVSPARADTALQTHCVAVAEKIEQDMKSHDWGQVLAGSHALDHDCGSANPLYKQAAALSASVAQFGLRHFDDALASARQCESLGDVAGALFECRLMEARSLDALGRFDEEKKLLTSMLDSLPTGRGNKQRKLVLAELSNIDPEAAKKYGGSKRGSGERRHEDLQDAKYSGTAFFVGDAGYLVTNRHVVAECSTYWTAGGQTLNLVKTDEVRDLALLKSAQPASAIARIRADAPKPGESIVVYGFPLPGLLASSGTVTTGIVSASAGLRNNLARFQISAPVQPGNSGGPVLDAEGRVIGVVQGKLADEIVKVTGQIPQNVNFGIPNGELLGFLKEAGLAPAPAGEGPKPDTADIAADARNFVTEIICSGVAHR